MNKGYFVKANVYGLAVYLKVKIRQSMCVWNVHTYLNLVHTYNLVLLRLKVEYTS